MTNRQQRPVPHCLHGLAKQNLARKRRWFHYEINRRTWKSEAANIRTPDITSVTMFWAELARRHGPVSTKKKFHGETAEISHHGDKVLLLSPTTLMNLSGNSVVSAKEFYRLPLRDILVISDDLNLPLGRVRFREKGSCGGQKGLRHIIQQLGERQHPAIANRYRPRARELGRCGFRTWKVLQSGTSPDRRNDRPGCRCGRLLAP